MLQLSSIKSLFCMAFLSCVVAFNATAAVDDPQPEQGVPFSYGWLKDYARNKAAEPYKSHAGELPKSLQGLNWDQYQQLGFDHDYALWKKNPNTLFRAELFHLGLFFNTPIRIYNLDEKGKTKQIKYSTNLFNYGKSGVKGEGLPDDLGFAGFRMQFHNDWTRDVVAFLGASYFRAVGQDMQYGLSARGLAVDTAMNRPEEFPVFTHFWLQTPAPNSDTTTVYALLDSPSVTGAYRFDITPGTTLKMRVDSALYPRKSIERLGIAPLTSMFLTGENDRRINWDWRPEIHDTDGLAMLTGNGEWIWRPLSNPAQLHFNAYADNNPKGFGLVQRDRNFDHYQDDGVFYEKRPALWVEPLSNWGEGSVQLVEIPTIDETFDNIVAFWNPKQPIEAGQELLYSYNLYWGAKPPVETERAQVVDTFTGIGGVVGQKRDHYSRRFVIDFKGGMLSMLGKDTKVKPVISVSSGKVEIPSARPQWHIGGYRAMFDIAPEDHVEPINIRVYLEANGQALTETWVYQWAPPPVDQRDLNNPSHL
jgi:glucans biosynthesis protein